MVLLMEPLVTHFAEELWERIGNKDSVFKAKWPEYDEKLCIEDSIEFVVQVSGKIRDKIQAPINISQEEVEKLAFESEKVKEWIKDKEIIKKIFVKNKLLNIVAK